MKSNKWNLKGEKTIIEKATNEAMKASTQTKEKKRYLNHLLKIKPSCNDTEKDDLEKFKNLNNSSRK